MDSSNQHDETCLDPRCPDHQPEAEDEELPAQAHSRLDRLLAHPDDPRREARRTWRQPGALRRFVELERLHGPSQPGDALAAATAILNGLDLPAEKRAAIGSILMTLPSPGFLQTPEARELARLLLPIVDGDRQAGILKLLRRMEQAGHLPAGIADELEAARRERPNPYLEFSQWFAWELSLAYFDTDNPKGRPSERFWALRADCIADELAGQQRIWPVVADLLRLFTAPLGKKFSGDLEHIRKVVVGYRNRHPQWRALKEACLRNAGVLPSLEFRRGEQVQTTSPVPPPLASEPAVKPAFDRLTCPGFTIEYWRDGAWYVGRLSETPGVSSREKTLDELVRSLSARR